MTYCLVRLRFSSEVKVNRILGMNIDKRFIKIKMHNRLHINKVTHMLHQESCEIDLATATRHYTGTQHKIN
jgi:hypothetical protein